MRSWIADYEVLEALPGATHGGARYLCRPPARLAWDDPVEVAEVAVGDDRWPQWTDGMARLAAVPGPDLRALIETGPDRAGTGAFISCESAPGGSLASPAPAGAAALDRAARIEAVATAARAAHALHEAGLAHGSIGPESVLLTRRGPVLSPPVLDRPEGLAARWSTGEVLSAVDPDVLRGEAPSRSSDIWSLGATLHRVLSDRSLYPGIGADQPVTAVQRVMFTRPELDPALEGEVRDLIARCLTPDPAGRPQTAAEVAQAITALGVGR